MRTPAPTQRPSSFDILWAAGIFEGEGHIRKNKSSEVITVGQNGFWLVERLQALFGGSIKWPKPGGRNQCAYWVVCGPRARGLAMTMYQFLSPRRQAQIRKAFED